jgi:hypothetical protein
MFFAAIVELFSLKQKQSFTRSYVIQSLTFYWERIQQEIPCCKKECYWDIYDMTAGLGER